MRVSLATEVAFAVACVTACTADSDAPSDLCTQAQAHLTECLGAEPAEVACDPAAASMILGETCAALTEPSKQDVFSTSLCRLGFLSRCPVTACAPSTASDQCSDYIAREDCSQCEYYLCRDNERSETCGAAGYYRGFGYEYCERFLEVTTPQLSPAGQRFAHDVRRCLMQALEDVPTDAACAAVTSTALGSHPDCYIEAGFCTLPLHDWVAIAATIQPGDASFKEMLETAKRCR